MLAGLRREAPDAGLDEADVFADPMDQFRAWMSEAIDAGLSFPNAMTLATATGAGAPSARIVLLNGIDERGFVFFTNYESRKGRESSSGRGLPLAGARAPGARRGTCGGAAARGVDCLLQVAPPWQPVGGLGVAPERCHRVAR